MTWPKKVLQLKLDMPHKNTVRQRALTPEQRQRRNHGMRGWRFGLKAREVEAMLAAQDGRCLICGDVMESGQGQKSMQLDHDRDTGLVRAFLCKDCNWKVWQFEAVQKFPADFTAKIEAYIAHYKGGAGT